MTTPPNVPMPPDVFEALVSAWADLLMADYYARHDQPTSAHAASGSKKPSRPPSRKSPYDSVRASLTACP